MPHSSSPCPAELHIYRGVVTYLQRRGYISTEAWLHIYRGVVTYLQRCGYISTEVWLHIYRGVVTYLQRCGYISTEVWLHIYRGVVTYLQRCGYIYAHTLICSVSLAKYNDNDTYVRCHFYDHSPSCFLLLSSKGHHCSDGGQDLSCYCPC